MKTQFLGQAYQSRSPILASQTAINIYPEISNASLDPTSPQLVSGFNGTPGLVSVFQGTGEVRGLHVAGSSLYAVIGSMVYRISKGYVGTTLGRLPNLSGRVSMTDNGTQVAIAHQDGWHYISTTGTAIAAVSGAPKNSILTTQDNYVAFTDGGGSFGLTALGDLSSIDPLDIATAEGLPDDLVSILADHREEWLFGTESIEIWSDTGASFFPFERAPGGFIEQGCAAAFSPVKLDNSVFWLGRDARGWGVVYRANAYIPQRVSTYPIEYAINQYGDVSDAFAYAYQDEGHSFYVITFPKANMTWAYDVATNGWHQRAYMDQYGMLHRHRGNCYATFNTDHLIGDWQNGKIYRMSLDLTTDDGDSIYRERAWELPDNENKKVRVDYLELIALTGDASSPLVWMQVSKDAGRTWSFQRRKSLGALGKRKARARWRRLGSGREIVLRVATNMTSRVSWVAANIRGEGLDQ